MSEPFFFDLKSGQGSDGGVSLYCKKTGEVEWPPQCRSFDNPKQLLGTVSDILGGSEEDFSVLRTPGNVLERQKMTPSQLKAFSFPNLNMLSSFPSGQGTLAEDDE